MELISQFRRLKRKRILVLSAGSLGSGVQGIYLDISAKGWHVLSHSFVPYAVRLRDLLKALVTEAQPQLSLSDAAWFDRKLSYLFLDCARTLLAAVSRSHSVPTFIVLNRLEMWKGAPDAAQPQEQWLLLAGSAHLLASSVGVPVFTGFSRHGQIFAARENLPLQAGIAKVARQSPGDCAFINLGLATRLFLVEQASGTVVLEQEAGPGMHLINLAAAEAGCPDGFDRDGLAARNGAVDHACVDALADAYLALTNHPMSLPELTRLYREGPAAQLSPADRLATVTALTARLAFQIYKRDCPAGLSPATLWVAGGGANNQTLREYLAAHFQPAKLRLTEELGMPASQFFPAALGLSVQTWIDHETPYWNPERNPRPETLGAWVLA